MVVAFGLGLYFALLFIAAANGGGSGMARDEVVALFEVMGDLLEDPSWAEYHPYPCTDTPWPGIQCELFLHGPLLHVTKIHLGPEISYPPCKLTAKLSNSILKLPYLKTLSLFNCFTNTAAPIYLSPSLFHHQSSLEQLVMKSNPGLAGEILATVGKLASLRVLSLSQNSLREGIPSELVKLRKLEQLDLSYNRLTGAIPEDIGELSSMTILDLCMNKLEAEIPATIGQLRLLQKLDLSYNNVSGKIPMEMGSMERLILLDLSHNRITGPTPETLSELKDLEYFLFDNNPIGGGVPLFLGSLHKLAVVAFSGCGLSGPIPPAIFGSLGSLTALSLDRNKLNGTIPSTLAALPSLGQLNLSENELSGEVSFPEAFVTKLGRRLDMRGNMGLCTRTQMYSNLPSAYWAAPPCLDSSAKSTNETNNPHLSRASSAAASPCATANCGSGRESKYWGLLRIQWSTLGTLGIFLSFFF